MTDFPIEDALEQQRPVLVDGDEVETPVQRDDVDPAQAYEDDRVVPLDEDEWL